MSKFEFAEKFARRLGYVVLGLAGLFVAFVLTLFVLLSGFSVGGKDDPVEHEVYELEIEAELAVKSGNIDEAIAIYRHAILRCADGERGPLRADRALCNAAVAELYEARGDLKQALLHYELLGEDGRHYERFDDVLRLRVSLYGLESALVWIEAVEPKRFGSKNYAAAQELFLEKEYYVGVVSSAASYLAACRMKAPIEELIASELQGYESEPHQVSTRSSRMRALNNLMRGQYGLGQFDAAGRSALAAILQADSPLLRNREIPYPQESAWGHAICARIAFDAGDMDLANLHYRNALSADSSASRWALLQPLVTWRKAETQLGL
ncbi:MAG: hypothetical protein OSB10_00720 [Planctomycetota bacterium]|nr:hypothetical protein [Planctomycetota bacterium]